MVAEGLIATERLKQQQYSTTVVTTCGQPDDAGSDSDEPEPDGRGGKRTSRDGSNEGAEVFQAGKRRVGVFQECSEGPSRASQPPLSFERAQALGGGVWQAGFPAFFLLISCRIF